MRSFIGINFIKPAVIIAEFRFHQFIPESEIQPVIPIKPFMVHIVMCRGCFILQQGQSNPVFRVNFIAQVCKQVINQVEYLPQKQNGPVNRDQHWNQDERKKFNQILQRVEGKNGKRGGVCAFVVCSVDADKNPGAVHPAIAKHPRLHYTH